MQRDPRQRFGVSGFAWLGDRAIRFPRPVGSSSRAIVHAVRAWPGVIDVVVARADVAAYFADEPVVADAAIAALAQLPDEGEPVRDVELPAIYDGEDLPYIARETGLSVDEIVRAHGAATYVVDLMGFAPGFAYLSGLDARLALPRRATPRPRVAAGSIGIAGAQTAVYPFDSPGGWHLIGRVDPASRVQMFGPGGALLRLGDRVRFARRG